MLKKRWIISLVFTFFLMTLISSAVYFIKEYNKPKIIVVTQRLDFEYWELFESGAKRAFRDLNIDGEVLAPASLYPATNQPNLLKKVLKKNPDALIVAPTDPSIAIPVLMEYKKQNIPVLLATRDMEWKYKTAYIGTDDIRLGKMAGMLLGTMLQPGDQVAFILGRLEDPVMIDRKNGAKKVLEDIGIEIITEQVGYDHFGDPKPVMENILQTYPNLKGVLAFSDRIAIEALKTIDEKGMKIPVTGVDGITEMVESIETEKVDVTIAQNPFDVGYLSVQQAQKAIKGENIEKRTDIGIDIITMDNAKKRLDFLQEVLN
ncbi:sugar ABC transporter substrate-binding protein [Metabacillus litoralis]|jgi:ribose transport system substrate-binding protein|uniref:sugar ABC transporter substrate-binding protein n=1 Tax=Metabacillus litoralis TaxID=152268 RepID=UPI00203DDB1D|nr:sugar ABC transporter substrate-binding protein [Metabacillus litoralis]MCM3652482.1 sugar ABC transporter substrate-binding protein [Metabacillus litoralis]